MPTPHQALRHSILREYLQEASFLYGHRKRALEVPDFTLADIATLEARLEAHLDGLALGAADAVLASRARADEGDAGELFAAVCLLCRLDQPADVAPLLSSANPDEPERALAIADALKYELPPTWLSAARAWLVDEGTPLQLVRAVATAAGSRRLPLATELLARARTLAGPDVVPFLWSLGRLGEPAAGMLFLRFMQQAEPESGRSAALAALRAGVARAADHLRQVDFGWAAIPLALTGDAVAVARLASSELPLALGFLGDPAALPQLLEAMEDPLQARAAALGLYLMTGAPLMASEAAAPSSEKVPPELPLPSLSETPATWSKWLAAHPLEPGTPVRLGAPYSQAALVRCLSDYRLPLDVRTLVVDELAIRFGIQMPFEPDMPAKQQAQQLESMRQAAAQPVAARPGIQRAR